MSRDRPTDVVGAARHMWIEIKVGAQSVWSKFESIFDSQGTKLCLQCQKPLDSPRGDLCSYQCRSAYWEEFSQVCKYYDKTPPCKFPACRKQCYVENNGHVYDYCGRSHAQEHKRLNEEAARQRRSQPKRGNQARGRGKKVGSSTSGSSGWSPQQQEGYFRGNHGYSPWNSDGPIHFYNRDEPYYEFTNFYNGAPIKLDGKDWKTTEHYFQAQKFVGTPYVELIRNAFGPRDAFNYSRDPLISPWRRSDWEEVTMDIMRKALFVKFERNSWLKKKLIDTGDRKLVERSPYDSFWGDGGDGTGENHLGKLLMELRSKLRGEDIQRDGGNGAQPEQGDSSVRYKTQTSGPPASSFVSSGNLSVDELVRRPLHTASTDVEPEEEKMETGNGNDQVPDLIVLDDPCSGQQKEPIFPEHMKPSSTPLTPERAAQDKTTESSPDDEMDTTQ